MEKFKAYVSMVENTLARQDFDHEPIELYQPISYILSLGGKRLRPAMVLAGCDLFTGNLEEALLPALAIEMFHNFSLVHDDIMDDADLRRGKKTIHQKWNTNVAILAGDAMLVKSYQYLNQVDKGKLAQVLDVFSKTALQVCEGQQYDMNFENSSSVSEEDYLEMIRLKTAVLLGAALQIGALIGQATNSQASALYQFGTNAGLAFQVQDDLLDAFGDPDKFGKKVGGDILQDKKTLLMIYARELAPVELKALENENLEGDVKVKAYQKFFIHCGAETKAIAKREELLKNALSALASADAKNEGVKIQLSNFAQWLSHRDH
ncbi:MAG: geranylgeranyl diphosphate synthase type II [Roseivirga sp.]|jgi:geranylgeranyl diphosphate synthase type II